MMKKLFLALASTLTLSLAAGLGACSETGTPGGGSAGGKFENLTTTQSVYGVQRRFGGHADFLDERRRAGFLRRSVGFLRFRRYVRFGTERPGAERFAGGAGRRPFRRGKGGAGRVYGARRKSFERRRFRDGFGGVRSGRIHGEDDRFLAGYAGECLLLRHVL